MFYKTIAVSVVSLMLGSVCVAGQTMEQTPAKSEQTSKTLGPYKKFSSLEEEKTFLEQSIPGWEEAIKRNPREATPEDHEQLRIRKARLKQVNVLLAEKNKK